MASHTRTEHEDATPLAQGACATIDMCTCGALQVHMGDLSLRLSPDVARSLMRTLGAALTRRDAILTERANAELASGNWSTGQARRGKA